MRRISSQMETLGPVRFVVLTGLIAGAIQGLPRLLLSGATTVSLQLVPFLVVGITAVLWWTAALFLWWIAVRRQQSSLGAIAAHVTVGLVIADVLATALGMVGASIETHGKFAVLIAPQLVTVIVSNLSFTLLRSLLWFVGSAIAIALGRHLNTAQQPLAAPAAGTPPGPVT